jgi:hypothetical protein
VWLYAHEVDTGLRIHHPPAKRLGPARADPRMILFSIMRDCGFSDESLGQSAG